MGWGVGFAVGMRVSVVVNGVAVEMRVSVVRMWKTPGTAEEAEETVGPEE